MVSLRERHSRPSYATIHEGLQGLSSDEDEPVASGSVPTGEGEVVAEEGPAHDDNDDQSSFSSGGSSEFDPNAEKERRRPKSAIPSGRDDAVQPASSPDSSFDDEDVVDEDEETSAGHEELGEGSRAVSPSSIVEIKPSIRPKSTKATPTSVPGTSEIARLPPIYRDLIQQSTKELTKSPLPSKTPNQGWVFRIFKADSLPCGPGTPYTARLKAPPRHRQVGEVKRTAELEDVQEREEARQNRNWALMRAYPLLSPWQTWEGEGYWPETYVGRPSGIGESSKTKQKSKLVDPQEWISREDVRLGLDNVGRLQAAQLRLLDAKQASLYMPIIADKTARSRIRCHIGPHGAQKRVDLGTFDQRPIHDYHPSAAGFLFNAGGPIWGLDWCPYPQRLSATQDFRQYLAVSTLPDIETRPTLGTKGPADAPGSIQIWSMVPPVSSQPDGDMPMDGHDPMGGMRCEMVLCVEGGPIMDLRWMPIGAWDEYEPSGPVGQSLPKLGIIVAIHCDGSIKFWPVPHPLAVKQARASASPAEQPLHVHLSAPLLKLEIPDACCTCLDWMTGSRLAVGLSNGHVAVWDVLEALQSGQSDLLPSVYMPVSLSGIRDLAAAHAPSSDRNGQARWGSDPFFLVCGGWDGSTVVMDVRDPDFPIELNRSRASSMAVGWSSQLGSPLYIDIEYYLVMYKLRGMGEGKGQYMAFQQGPVWGIGTSEYHTMLLTAGCDGSVLLSNCKGGFHRARGEGLMQQRMMQMDYDLHTGEYRLLDNFLPEHISLEVTLNRVAKDKAKSSNPMLMKSASWLPQVAVHRVRWNDSNGLSNAGWYAAGTASGLGRIEWVEGRFRRGQVPKMAEQ